LTEIRLIKKHIHIMKLTTIRPSVLSFAVSAFLLPCLSLRASEMDERIESAASNSYVYKTYLKDDAVKVESKSGVVTLTGTVKERFHKSLAADTVEVLPGVKSVDNQLSLKEETSIDNADRWLILKVETALLFHSGVNVMKTKVSAEDGTVYLRGEAASNEVKELATDYARDVEGVKVVKNEMTVSKTPVEPHRTMKEKVDDASITALVKASQLAHLSTSTITTKVETREGVVTITGVAKSTVEKKHVTKLTSDIYGVNKVINQMKIKEN
jgi:hyperosmotically inducible periplasmic protein